MHKCVSYLCSILKTKHEKQQSTITHEILVYINKTQNTSTEEVILTNFGASEQHRIIDTKN